ncbi:EamA family transporter [Synechococcus sp. MIT S9504]|uniref:EamA family transporter n=1 Tax=Synechococcus sp. MIT S9504 TaxID=1801628 RepID=UPI0007BB5192|nr:EamA family transporter [Synechococcus sp. MIT S9504]KZR87735.1 EamA-like transporter family protein [Synechococcus sp. MIT S9504]
MKNGLKWGISSVFAIASFTILSKYLLQYFSVGWLLLASGLGIILLLEKAKKNWNVYKGWSKKEWKLVFALAMLSGAFNICFFLGLNFLPASIMTMLLGLSPLLLILRTCQIEKRKPMALEAASGLSAITGAYLMLGIRFQSYSLIGIACGIGALVFLTNADILQGRMREKINASEAVFTKQSSKILFGFIAILIWSKAPAFAPSSTAISWILLIMIGGLNMLGSFTVSKTAFALPPLPFVNILLLNLPIVAIFDIWLFNDYLRPVQWAGVSMMATSAILGIYSGEERLEAI